MGHELLLAARQPSHEALGLAAAERYFRERAEVHERGVLRGWALFNASNLAAISELLWYL